MLLYETSVDGGTGTTSVEKGGCIEGFGIIEGREDNLHGEFISSNSLNVAFRGFELTKSFDSFFIGKGI